MSVYASWLTLHPSAKGSWAYADASAHRILSDLSAFIGHSPSEHRILAAGDLNMFYGATGSRLSMPKRECTVWGRMEVLGLEFLGPQAPHGRSAASAPDDVPPDTKNVPTFYRSGGPEAAVNQLDYAFASRGFHKSVSVRAMNDATEWGPSDHCRPDDRGGHQGQPELTGRSAARLGLRRSSVPIAGWTRRRGRTCSSAVGS